MDYIHGHLLLIIWQEVFAHWLADLLLLSAMRILTPISLSYRFMCTLTDKTTVAIP